MLRKLRPRSAYDVMAAIAFFIAVAGGSAYAAATIGSSDIKNDAVRSNHIKNGQVKNPDLAANSVGTGKVINGSLLKQDFKPGQLPQGPPGVSGLELIDADSGPQNSNSGKQATATCSAGKRVIGGSGEIQGGVSGADPNVVDDVVIDEVDLSPPSAVPGSVTVQAFENKATAVNWGIVAHAICAKVS